MKRYLIGLFLVLLVAGCQQQAATTEPPATTIPTEPAVTEQTPSTPAEEEIPVTEEPLLGAQEEPATGSDVSILGKGGFDPEELTVKKGATVTFMNNDPKGKAIVLTFKAGKKFINSDKMEAGEKYEQEFAEAGTYEYWSLAYGVKAKIIVE